MCVFIATCAQGVYFTFHFDNDDDDDDDFRDNSQLYSK